MRSEHFIYEAGFEELLAWSDDREWSENFAGFYVTAGFCACAAADVVRLPWSEDREIHHGDYLKDNVYGPFSTIEAANAAIKEMKKKK